MLSNKTILKGVAGLRLCPSPRPARPRLQPSRSPPARWGETWTTGPRTSHGLVLQELILELEVVLNPLAPLLLDVEVDVRALLELAIHKHRVLVAQEPGEVLRVVPPGQLLQLPGGQVLLVGALLIIEYEEQSVQVVLLEHP